VNNTFGGGCGDVMTITDNQTIMVQMTRQLRSIWH